METIIAKGNDLNIEAFGSTICYNDFGTGNIPIIFIHGFPFDKSSWNPQMEFLKKNRRVIAYDISGFGKSTARTGKANISLFANDLIEIMNVLEIDKAIVCGLSMGGYILLDAVSRFPERFEAIILSSTQCIADLPEGKEKRKSDIEHIRLNGLADFAIATIKNVFCKDTLDNRKQLVETIRNLILSTSSLAITTTLGVLADREEICTVLNKISVPTLILSGKDDTLIHPVQAEFLHSCIANSTLHIIDNAGHLTNLEQPQKFNLHILKFIKSLPD